jgi:hypothetical protein
MLGNPDARWRQAAAFGLSELGGASSSRLLEARLVHEEARGDHDGVSVAQAITRALGRIEDAGARASLLRRLERLTASRAGPSEVNELGRALWRRRHPELLPHVLKALERLSPQPVSSLHGLALLLEKSPGELRAWALDPAVPVDWKTSVLTVLEEDLPDSLSSTLPSFISMARTLVEGAARQRGEASYYCERLLTLVQLHEDWLLPALAPQVRSELRDLARSLVPAVSLNCALRAAVILQSVGLPEDAALIEAHRPSEPVLSQVFDDAVRALRGSRRE